MSKDPEFLLKLALAIDPCAPDLDFCTSRGDDTACAMARRVLAEHHFRYDHKARGWVKS